MPRVEHHAGHPAPVPAKRGTLPIFVLCTVNYFSEGLKLCPAKLRTLLALRLCPAKLRTLLALRSVVSSEAKDTTGASVVVSSEAKDTTGASVCLSVVSSEAKDTTGASVRLL